MTPGATPALAPADRFRALIARRLGLFLDDTKTSQIENLRHRRATAHGRSVERYLNAPEADFENGEIGALALDLTVPETYFFRNAEQFRALAGEAIPGLLRLRGAGARLRVLSAGCATGEEPYTVAMVARETLEEAAARVSILAVDVNPTALDRARRGRYSPWALRETTGEARRRWFQIEGRELAVEESIRAMVSFEARNLAGGDLAAWPPGPFDVVFFRNVLMYFTPEAARAAVARVEAALAPGGYLFLGHAETLRGLSNAFHLLHTHDTFYYQKKEAGQAPPPRAPAAPEPFAPSAVDVAQAASWVEVIGRATERISALAAAHDAAEVVGSPPADASDVRPAAGARPGGETPGLEAAPAWDLSQPLELLARERFADALLHLRALPPGSDGDPDVLLLHAALLVQQGRPDECEETCRRLLSRDDLNAGAHYLLALCRERAGDGRAAADHDQTAAYLDPGFAMPRLHLGLMARRAGERERALGELSQALTLLQREDSSRLVLFGGGFSREALASLCRAEISALGGQA